MFQTDPQQHVDDNFDAAELCDVCKTILQQNEPWVIQMTNCLGNSMTETKQVDGMTNH